MADTANYSPGELHRLAVRVAKAARLADSPIGYYNAYADIRELLVTRSLADLPALFERFYGSDAWQASSPGDPIYALEGDRS